MPNESAPGWRRYGFALLTTTMACACTLAAPPLHKLPTALFFAAVTLTSFFGGLGPGLVATALGTLALDYFFISPVHNLSQGLEETVRVASFALAAALINSLHERRRRAEARERTILETTVDCIITIDHEGKLLDLNPAAEHLFGYRRADAVGREAVDLIVPPATRERYRRALAQLVTEGQSELTGRRVEATVMRADGSEFPAELGLARVPLEGPPIIRGFVRDITERRRTEEAERHSDSLRSVTRLANAAAHEINNPLSVILVDLDLLSRQVSSNPAALGHIERAREAARRVEEIVGRMTRITRLEVMPQPADLPELLDLFKSTPDSQPEPRKHPRPNWAAMYRDEWMTINGVRLHWQDWGPREAPVLLALHGLTQQSHTFDGVAERFGGRYRLIALDFRGRGESEWAAPETYALPQYVDDVVKLLDALEIPAAHILGTSLGGLCGLSVGAFHPQRLLSLALNDIGPEIDPAGGARIAAYTVDVPASFPTLDAVVDWALGRYLWLRRLPRAQVTEQIRWAVREGSGGWRLKFDPAIGRVPRPSPEVMAAAGELWWKALESLPCPMLLVRGAESDVLSRETADEMARRQPGLVRAEVAGMGHAPMLSEPAAVEALDRFYKG